MPNDESRFGAERWNRLRVEITEMAMDYVNGLIDDLLADRGVPPGNVPITDPLREYTRLLALRDMGSQHFWGNPLAQRRLAQLEAQFGQTPAQQPAPFP